MTALLLLRRFWWAIPLALAMIWVARIDSLRATYKRNWQAVTAEYAAFQTKIIDRTAEALRLEREQKARVEAEYQEKANASDERHQDALADARAAADRYIARNRLRVQIAGSAGGQASPAADSGDSGLSEILSNSGVVVSEGDVQACTAAMTYAVAAHNWAVSMEAR